MSSSTAASGEIIACAFAFLFASSFLKGKHFREVSSLTVVLGDTITLVSALRLNPRLCEVVDFEILLGETIIPVITFPSSMSSGEVAVHEPVGMNFPSVSTDMLMSCQPGLLISFRLRVNSPWMSRRKMFF